MDWSRLPSLAALRAFDALARNGSLSAAARQLNVTHAAIAQHLRTLENFFGESLATRNGQAMQLWLFAGGVAE
ncbi:MAG: LysR family transcriptional regulator [Maritimibacter sp.]